MPCDCLISSRCSRTTASYSVVCSAVSGTNRSVSVLGGSSGAMSGSVLRRRSRNGRTVVASRSVASLSRSRSIGRATVLRNRSSGPSSPGVVQSTMDHSSVSRFSTGVPVSATLALAGTFRSSRAVFDKGFLTCWASSMASSPQSTSDSVARSRRSTPYVPSTTSSGARSSRWRPPPWNRRTGMSGANRANSRSQLPSSDVGQSTCGLRSHSGGRRREAAGVAGRERRAGQSQRREAEGPAAG